jgi:uncharacterized protein (DUF433 family)
MASKTGRSISFGEIFKLQTITKVSLEIRHEVAILKSMEYRDRITIESGKCGGRPCVRGMRIRVVDVLDLLANGLSFDEVLEELPDLELDDIKACLTFARNRMDHAVIAV